MGSFSLLADRDDSDDAMSGRRYRLPPMSDDPARRPPSIETADGEHLDAAWSEGDSVQAVAVLTHPHPLYGGDKDNIVPASLARSLPAHGIATLRIDFRGVGGSSGTHGGGSAEVADVVAAIDAAQHAFEDRPVIAVGYSFGADVLLAVDDSRLRAVVTVAPPLAVLPTDRLAAPRGGTPTLILSPVHDQFRTPADAAAVVEAWPDTEVVEIPGADHFMAGATSFVVDRVVEFVGGIIPPD